MGVLYYAGLTVPLNDEDLRVLDLVVSEFLAVDKTVVMETSKNGHYLSLHISRGVPLRFEYTGAMPPSYSEAAYGTAMGRVIAGDRLPVVPYEVIKNDD